MIQFRGFILLVLFCALIPNLIGDRTGFTSRRLLVCIPDGCVVGTTEDGNEKPFDAWYGIPYATPPIDDLRFKVIF